MTAANETRRNVMLMAWSFRRAEPTRAFTDCLRGAWAYSKRLAEAAAKMIARAKKAGGHLRLSASLIRSPIRRATSTQRYGGQADYCAAYTTAVLGR